MFIPGAGEGKRGYLSPLAKQPLKQTGCPDCQTACGYDLETGLIFQALFGFFPPRLLYGLLCASLKPGQSGK